MMVSVALFTIVMMVALGALLGLSEANRKADAISAAVNNLGAALDVMSRTIRTGTQYHGQSNGGINATCGPTVLTSPEDCIGSPGANVFAFLNSDGVEVVYIFENTTVDPSGAAQKCGQATGTVGCILRSTDGGSTWLPMTSPDVVITNLTFYVTGSTRGSPDNEQPRVIILIAGYVAVTSVQQSAFRIESSVTQRVYDQ